MDDYILEILKMQEQPEESQPMKLRTEEINARQWAAEASAGQKREMLRNAAAGAEFSEEDDAAQQRMLYRSSEENQQWLLKQMVPLEVHSGVDIQYGDARSTEISRGETARITTALRYGIEKNSEAGVSPESLSMFFQRDARRYS